MKKTENGDMRRKAEKSEKYEEKQEEEERAEYTSQHNLLPQTATQRN